MYKSISKKFFGHQKVLYKIVDGKVMSKYSGGKDKRKSLKNEMNHNKGFVFFDKVIFSQKLLFIWSYIIRFRFLLYWPHSSHT